MTAVTATSAEGDKYDVLEKIGHGSFGVIRKVKRKTDGKIVCRKEINYVKMSIREREQLAAEFNILSSLRHENIVAYYQRDHLRDQQEVHLYMEYCGGGDLSTKIKEFRRTERHPPEEYVWDIISQLISALYRCHNGEAPPAVEGNILGPPASPKKLRSKTQVMILHRDLKPENIFLGEDDSVKLGDFGLSKVMGHADFTSTYVGTPYYMSPEICSGEKYGWHSDIWAMGCIIYELCSSRPPFDAQSHLLLMQEIKGCRYKPLPNIYSKELKELVSSCLQVNPTKRPQTRDIINMPIVRIMRKAREIVGVKKALEAQKQQAAQKLADVTLKNVELQALVAQTEASSQALIAKTRQETLDTMRTDIDASLRREWEVKAQLEISKHCKLESDRLQQVFNTEFEKRVSNEVALRLNAYKQSKRNKEHSAGVDTPPSSDMSKLSFDSPLIQPLSVPSLKKPGRTPFARAKTQVVATDSPMDIQMTSPSPMCASLSLSPRRAAAIASISAPSLAPSNLFATQAAARERWQPQLAYDSASEDEEEQDILPELPSPVVTRGQPRVLGATTGIDPFKSTKPAGSSRPGFRRQSTLPVSTATSQPLIFGDGVASNTTSHLPTPVSPTRKQNRLLTKAVTTASTNIGAGTAGRTLIELNAARVANMSNIPRSSPVFPPRFDVEGPENHRPGTGNAKEEVAVWDPDVDIDMPSPFLVRRGRGITG